MTWHWASKEMPLRNKPVLLAWLNIDNEYTEECITVVKSDYEGTKWIESTLNGGMTFDVEPGDKWAYMEPPE